MPFNRTYLQHVHRIHEWFAKRHRITTGQCKERNPKKVMHALGKSVREMRYQNNYSHHYTETAPLHSRCKTWMEQAEKLASAKLKELAIKSVETEVAPVRN